MAGVSSNKHGTVVLVLWLLTFGLAYVGVGGWLDSRVEGIDPSQIPQGLAVLALLSLLVSLAGTVLWARPLGRPDAGPPASPDGLGRRRLLLGAASGLGGMLAVVGASFVKPWGWLTVTGPAIQPQVPRTSPVAKPEWKGSRIQRYRKLGRTGALVSDISLGTGRINLDNDGEAIARRAIERGVTYFDTAPDYSGFGSELAMGRAMKGHRDKMFLATKFCTHDGHLATGSSVQAYMQAVEGSLERLQTDYVDLVHIHSCNTVERLLDENAHEAFDRLREQGKARFLGVSTHTPNLQAVADAAIDSGRFDVMMLAYHFGAWPGLGAILERAAKNDIGVVAMKTLKGAKHQGLLELTEPGESYPQAGFKWVLSNPNVSCLVISFFEHQHVDEYLYASGRPPTAQDVSLLERYDERIAGKYCFPHCGACLEACPEQLAIHDVLRHRMYFEDYGNQKEAMQLYSRLDRKADMCATCPAPCRSACPHEVPIRERMMGAHRMLTLAAG